MSRGWGGRALGPLRAQVEHAYGRTCWICGHPIEGQISIDHVIPRKHLPKERWYDLELLRPAHLRCNLKRGTKNAAAVNTQRKPSRSW
jgi:5-methylcytosine-specific restriction endonuclease McrA